MIIFSPKTARWTHNRTGMVWRVKSGWIKYKVYDPSGWSIASFSSRYRAEEYCKAKMKHGDVILYN